MLKKIVIIPTYNERENIEDIIRAVFTLHQTFDILIVDDNSPDGTANIVKGLQAHEYKLNLHILERKIKNGLGTAYIDGFKWCLKNGYEYIFEMDADFSHNPSDLPKLFEALCEGADVSIGSRYKTGVNVVNWPMSRVMMSYFASAYVRFITGMNIRDTTAGFVGYRSKVLRHIDLDKIKFRGYAFQIEMKFTAWKHGFTIEEVPIIFTDRTKGESKISKGIIQEAIGGVVSMKVKSWFRKYQKYTTS
ncbi:MAG: polyprenol monophosphomannose synthase [Bacteroidia bacterium]|nr:polyprenol monophosphomannose synthase [Bacteroidia bacterium]MCF8426970.1 polyprenol monophosphomannose synthase [Bacteroidia bacterium]